MNNHLGSHRGHGSQNIREKYWMPLEGKHKAGAWEVLDAAYSEPHRAYHTWEHIGDMLEKLSAFSGFSARRDIIAISTFWHDAVYKTKNDDGSLRPDADNVRDSAGLFRQYTLLNQSDADAVYDLIIATANHLGACARKIHYCGFSGDLDLFMDLDLSSLASPWESFTEDFARIRFEFSCVPEIDFCSRQLQILENFAKEDARLYRRAETRDKWAAAAKLNLTRCIAGTKKRIAELSNTGRHKP